ncbi:MAG: hypothetical protein A4E36_01783 [Methanoregulaceae archaeon PtaB.Bin009]|jgi:nitroreductase|nr:MAG: hypothetical protein A4E36_01783 [Methanoregulaceae archaeon PtaB.Bin009]
MCNTIQETTPVTPLDPSDARCNAVKYAILAPSPHNTQPWRVAFQGDERIILSIDHSRLIPGCDPLGRQAFISVGAFLENLDLAAKNSGLRADIDLFPAGWPDSRLVQDTPVARVDLVEDPHIEPDPLFLQIPLRHTSRRRFEKRKVPLDAAGEITAAYDFSLVPLGFSHDDDLIHAIADVAADAMEIELADPERFRETLQYFRFTDAEAHTAQDGFGHAQSGYGPVMRFFIGRFILPRSKAASSPESFSRMAKRSTREQAASAGGIGWLSTKGDHRVDQVRTGRAFQRVHLKACALGLALHPMSQLLADYPGMAGLRSVLRDLLGVPDTQAVQMLFRMGYARPVLPTPRRRPGDFFFP